MKKLLFLILIILGLSGCERPATVSNWSPIEDADVPSMEITPSAGTGDEVDLPTEGIMPPAMLTPEVIPPLDVNSLPDILPSSMKGYELVSWQSGDEWNFTLVTGTNRLKTFEELISPESSVTESGYVKITVSGMDEIEQVLKRVPSGDSIAWSGMDLTGQVPSGTLYFSYPPQEIMDALFGLAEECGFELYTLQESE